MTGRKARAIRIFVLINLLAWLGALIPAEGLRDRYTLLVWSAFWLAIVLPASIALALHGDRHWEQWRILRHKQSLLINRHLTDWTGRNRAPDPDRDETGDGDAGAEP